MFSRTMQTLWLIALSLLGGSSSGTEDECSYSILRRYLKLDIKNPELAEMRPVLNWTQSTNVYVDMFLSGILNVDEKSQTLTTFILLSVQWNNELLKWNPTDFCGITHFSVPKEKLWKPDIIIYENIMDPDIRNSPFSVVNYFGHCTLSDYYRLTTTCKMDLYRFPFDSQTCSITFRAAQHTSKEITLGAFTSSKDMNTIVRAWMTSQGEWEFVGVNMTPYIYHGEYFDLDHLIYKITLKRRPLLYIINLVVPIIFFLILDVASFFISEVRGEKLGFKVTILLSISVLLLILQDILPSTADQLPLMALLCIVIFLLTGLSLLETMVVSFLVDKGSQVGEDVEVSSEASSAAKDDAGDQQEPVGNPDICLEMPEGEKSGRIDLDVEWLNNANQLKQILEELRVFRQIWLSTRRLKITGKPGYYKRIARHIDNIYICFYLIISVGFLVFMNISWFW